MHTLATAISNDNNNNNKNYFEICKLPRKSPLEGKMDDFLMGKGINQAIILRCLIPVDCYCCCYSFFSLLISFGVQICARCKCMCVCVYVQRGRAPSPQLFLVMSPHNHHLHANDSNETVLFSPSLQIYVSFLRLVQPMAIVN